MNFLQPWLLVALPLAALPIIIHLINQRRFQTIRWGAMMFLLAAQKMSRGYSRIRQWLIMLFRMLAIAGLIFAISRPLSSGSLGQVGGGIADATIVLLDRSASMQQTGAGGALSKLETSKSQLAQMLGLTRSARWVLIESAEAQAREIESPRALLDMPTTEGTSSAADIPRMLETARDYIQANQLGRTEVWICSDLRKNDWSPESGRWGALRESLKSLPQGVRIHLLAYPQEGSENFSLRVTEVKRQSGEQGELLVSLKVARSGISTEPVTIPLEFEIEGARSVVQVEMQGGEYELKDHRIALEQHQERGWGKVSIPADVNPADNTYYLAYGPAPERRALIVAEDDETGEPLKLAAEIPPGDKIACVAEVVGIEQLPTVEWEKIGMVLWQARLPEGGEGEELKRFVDRGGVVICFPPKSPTGESFAGMKWERWSETPKEVKVETWRGDEDLLANTLNGRALPVGELSVKRMCSAVPAGETENQVTPLATLSGGKVLLSRVPTDRGGIYFCATTPRREDSSLSVNGVVLYVMIQRGLEIGSEILKTIRYHEAGAIPGEDFTNWEQLSKNEGGSPSEMPFHAGVYSAGDRMIVVNRPRAEDEIGEVEEGPLEGLFAGLDFSRVDDAAGNLNSLIQEIWRIFMACMIVALVVEAALCLPSREQKKGVAPVRGGAFEGGGA